MQASESLSSVHGRQVVTWWRSGYHARNRLQATFFFPLLCSLLRKDPITHAWKITYLLILNAKMAPSLQ